MPAEPEWIRYDPDEETIRRLCAGLSCTEVVARILVNRGITDPTRASRFIDATVDELHPAAALPHIAEATQRLQTAVDAHDTICVYADRDIDGIAGAATLVQLLGTLGADVVPYVPGKWEGYGFSTESIEELATAGVDLLISVDCGTTAAEPIATAQEKGLDVVVTDHHQPDETDLPSIPLVNPQLSDSTYPNEHLAGGAVAMKVGEALLDRTHTIAQSDYYKYALPLAALATLGDYARLTLENRAIVWAGLDRLNSCGLSGLQRTAEHTGVASPQDLSWSLIPLLNAAQEDESGTLMLDLLLGSETEEIDRQINLLETYREERKAARAARQAHLEECLHEQLEPHEEAMLLVETDRWVGGVPARRLSERWGKPVITYRQKGEAYVGGGRTDQDVDLFGLVQACGDHLEDYWGHPGAPGFRASKTELDSLCSCLTEELQRRYDEEDLRPRLEIDTTISTDDLTEDLVESIGALEPFGHGLAQPVFLVEDVDIESVGLFGSEYEHVRFEPADDAGVSIRHWGGKQQAMGLAAPLRAHLVGQVAWDDYRDVPALDVQDYAIRSESGQ